LKLGERRLTSETVSPHLGGSHPHPFDEQGLVFGTVWGRFGPET
jgi:hypothetical protein